MRRGALEETVREDAMSSESDSVRKWSHQFGLYRARVDAKTEEFLRMSRRRQLRRGCACAAASTALTVAVVVVLVVAYEYTIAVDSGLTTNGFNQRGPHKNNTLQKYYAPVADKLNRQNSFITNQESFETMPLMINALQENNYVDPSAEQQLIPDFSSRPAEQERSLKTWNRVKKTSPRPFIFEYRSPTPSPFTKTAHYSSRTWLDDYRNTQRVKNLEHVINYLQKTVHAKVADLVPLSSNRLVTFSGSYMQPIPQQEPELTPAESGAAIQLGVTGGGAGGRGGYNSDLLFKYKPDSPGEVNMLADEMLQFSPVPAPPVVLHETKTLTPLFRPIKYLPRDICYGLICSIPAFLPKTKDKGTKHENKEYHSMPSQDEAKVLSLMLDIFPMVNRNQQQATSSHLRKLSKSPLQRPSYQFRLKSHTPLNFLYNRPKPTIIPINMKPYIQRYNVARKSTEKATSERNLIGKENNIFPYPKETIIINSESNIDQPKNVPSLIDRPVVLEKQVPANSLSTQLPIYQITTARSDARSNVNLTNNDHLRNMFSLVEHAHAATDSPSWSTIPPEILKFSHEDAKLPDPYRADRRSSLTQKPAERRPVLIKLKNESTTSSTTTTTSVPVARAASTSPAATAASSPAASVPLPPADTATSQPQLNGHYRGSGRTSPSASRWPPAGEPAESAAGRRARVTAAPPPPASDARPSYVLIDRDVARPQWRPGARPIPDCD